MVEPPTTAMSTRSRSRWRYRMRGYALGQSFDQLRERWLGSFMTLSVLGISLTLPVVLLFASFSLSDLLQETHREESLTLYLQIGVADTDARQLAGNILQRPDVASTRHISPTVALDDLATRSNMRAAVQLLDSNPLPAAIVVVPDFAAQPDIARHEVAGNLALALSENPQVARVQLDLEWVQKLQALGSLLWRLGGLLAGFLVLTAFLVLTNTVRLELMRRQPELAVARLLGASRQFRHRSLVYTGALYGVLGGAVALLAASGILWWVKPAADALADLYGISTHLSVPSVPWALAILVCFCAFGIVGALLVLHRPTHQSSSSPLSP